MVQMSRHSLRTAVRPRRENRRNRSRTSGAYLLRLGMTPSSQGMEPPVKPDGFNHAYRLIWATAKRRPFL